MFPLSVEVVGETTDIPGVLAPGAAGLVDAGLAVKYLIAVMTPIANRAQITRAAPPSPAHQSQRRVDFGAVSFPRTGSGGRNSLSPWTSRSRAELKAVMLSKRFFGSLARALIKTCSTDSGISRTNWVGRGSGSVAFLTMTAIGVSARKGVRPVTNS